MADVIFNSIKYYGFMHSSFFIIDPIIEATEREISSIRHYFEGSFYTAKHIFDSKTQRSIKDKEMRKTPSYGPYARMKTQISVEEKKIQSKLLDKSKALKPLRLKYMDLPFIFDQNEAGFAYVKALNKCQDLEIFKLASVQIVIDCHYEHWWKRSMLFIGLPMSL